ncbi:MAG: rhomboid family intramembrane serine protease [bacterium]
MDYSSRQFQAFPPVVKNIIIINVLMYLGTEALTRIGSPIPQYLVLWFFGSDRFMIHQLVTHMFMHANFIHLFFNMFMFYMFGRALENVWGSKRFLIYYFVTGLGAALLHQGVIYFQYHDYIIQLSGQLNLSVLGASGAVYGVLLAFGMLFPNTVLMLLFPPIPIKAKWMVVILGAVALFLGLTQPGSNIAHFAHLGGMIFGYLLIKYWQRNRKNFY